MAFNEDNNKVVKATSTNTSLLSDVRLIVEQGLQTAYQGVNSVMVKTYWQVGRRIVEEEQQGEKRAEYGKQIITLLAEDLSKSYNRGFTARDLRSYRQFYLSFKDLEIWHSRVPNLSWTHFRTMLRVADDNARYWYMREASKEMWSVRTLDRNIASQYYYRLLQSPKKEEVIEEMHQLTAPLQDPHEFIKSPVVAVGKGFAFVAEQQHIRTEQNDYFIDLVFYNYMLKSFVLIDLKTTRLSYQDVGQMDMYLQMYDELKRTEGDNPTVGIILCSETDGDVARYSTLAKNDQLFAAKYLTYLPTEEQLRKEIEQQKILFEQQNHESD